MVRLLLVAAPALCVISGLGLSQMLYDFTRHIRYYREWRDYQDALEEPAAADDEETGSPQKRVKTATAPPKYGYPLETAICVIITIAVSTMVFFTHCTWVSAEAYSSPTIVIA